MPKPENWEFDCPQFVDFEAGLNDRSIENVDFGLSVTESFVGVISFDGKAGPKMATPKWRPNRKVLKKSPLVTIARPVQTDDEKLAKLGNGNHRLSKSDGFINHAGKSVKRLQNNRPRQVIKSLRRSLSDNCLKIKKKVYPTTPMCLKRTLHKPKTKGKTSEELELEIITELQNKLSKQLKLNEVNLQRIKKNKAPYALEDMYRIKSKIDNAPKDEIKNLKRPTLQREFKRNDGKLKIPMENQLDKKVFQQKDRNNVLSLKKKSERLQKVLDSVRPSCASAPKALRVINGEKEENKEEKPLFQKAPFTKFGVHCGIKFLPNQENTVPHPFSFDASSASLPNTSLKFKTNVAPFSSIWIPNVARDKENLIPSPRNSIRTTKK